MKVKHFIKYLFSYQKICFAVDKYSRLTITKHVLDEAYKNLLKRKIKNIKTIKNDVLYVEIEGGKYGELI